MCCGRLVEFFFPGGATKWIGILRAGLGFQLILYSISLRGDWTYFFGSGEGLINRDLTEGILNLESPFVPRLGWLVSLGQQVGLSEAWTLTFTWFLFLASGLGLLVGFWSRAAAISGWMLHLAVRSSGGFITYGVDQFITIGLFYLAIAPLPDRYSLDCLLRGKKEPDLWRVGFQQRILQLHLCFIYFFGGLSKSLGAGWWNGTSIWRALIRPPFNLINPNLLRDWSFLLPITGITICVLELGYPVFIWLKSTQRLWLTAILAMHAAIAVLMGLYLFAGVMIVLNLAAFGAVVTHPQPRQKS